MFKGQPRNERWETIQRRRTRNDIIAAIVGAPAMYLVIVLWCAL
jgi:hypothetical protein